MFTLSGIRNGLWCIVAFGIVACASTPMPSDKLAVAQTSIQRAEQAQAAQFAAVELTNARNKLAAAQAAADKRDADLAARMADQAEVDAQLAEFTARAKQQEQLVSEMDASLNDLRNEAQRKSTLPTSPATVPVPVPQSSPTPPSSPSPPQ